jgi:hypothetical protein
MLLGFLKDENELIQMKNENQFSRICLSHHVLNLVVSDVNSPMYQMFNN